MKTVELLPSNVISIHALRGEGDSDCLLQACQFQEHFNPRPPWGGRLLHSHHRAHPRRFQSTPSVGRATYTSNTDFTSGPISIHALRGEGDCQAFLPLAPSSIISIHALRGEGDTRHQPLFFSVFHISIHALRGEGDYSYAIIFAARFVFQSTPSVGRATARLCESR